MQLGRHVGGGGRVLAGWERGVEHCFVSSPWGRFVCCGRAGESGNATFFGAGAGIMVIAFWQ